MLVMAWQPTSRTSVWTALALEDIEMVGMPEYIVWGAWSRKRAGCGDQYPRCYSGENDQHCVHRRAYGPHLYNEP